MALCATFALGCDRSTPAVPAARPTVPPGPGVISGVVRFAGPRLTAETPTTGGECCPGVPRPADESLVVADDGSLRNVIVYVKDGPNVAGPPPAKALLSQVGCRYIPHELALRVGQTLVVTNSDPTMHNVHVDPSASGNPTANFSQVKGSSQAVTFPAADDDLQFKCDVHAWMRAHAMVFDHPCYGITGDDGAFRLERLPAGTYTVVAHHEKLGDLTQAVTVTADKPTANVRFEYHP